MDTDHGADLLNLTARIARVVQTTVGWIFWDPGAVARYADLGLPEAFAGPLGYIAARCAPLAPAGPAAVPDHAADAGNPDRPPGFRPRRR